MYSSASVPNRLALPAERDNQSRGVGDIAYVGLVSITGS